MAQIDRFSVSLDTELLAAFDRHIAERRYENRSEAVRDMIRDQLLTARLGHGDNAVAATVTFMCDHRMHDPAKRVRSCLAGHGAAVVGSLWIPLDGHCDCVTVGLKGSASTIRTLADELQAIRGVSHAQFWVVPVDDSMPVGSMRHRAGSKDL